MSESYTVGEKIVRYASQNETHGLYLQLKEVEELLTGGSIMQALSMASGAGFTESVEVILDSKLFNMYSAEQQKSMLSSAIASTDKENASMLDVLQSKKTSLHGGSRKTRRRVTRKRY